MRKTKFGALALSAAVASALCATVSQAALIELGDQNITLNGGTPLIVAGQGASGTYWNGTGFQSFNTTAGTFKLGVANTGPTRTGTIYTYCTDIGVFWASGKTYEAVQFSDAVANGVRPAWSAVTESIENASWLYNTYFVGNASYLTDNKLAAGMQLAIWKVLYDTVDTSGIVNPTAWTAGNFRVGSAGTGLSWATQLLTDLNTARQNNTFTVYSDTWLHPVNENSQGMIYNDLTPIPEPTTVLAGALLLLPFAASTIRFVRKNRTA